MMRFYTLVYKSAQNGNVLGFLLFLAWLQQSQVLCRVSCGGGEFIHTRHKNTHLCECCSVVSNCATLFLWTRCGCRNAGRVKFRDWRPNNELFENGGVARTLLVKTLSKFIQDKVTRETLTTVCNKGASVGLVGADFFVEVLKNKIGMFKS